MSTVCSATSNKKNQDENTICCTASGATHASWFPSDAYHFSDVDEEPIHEGQHSCCEAVTGAGELDAGVCRGREHTIRGAGDGDGLTRRTVTGPRLSVSGSIRVIGMFASLRETTKLGIIGPASAGREMVDVVDIQVVLEGRGRKGQLNESLRAMRFVFFPMS